MQQQHHTYTKKLGQVTSHQSKQVISTETTGQLTRLKSQTELLVESDTINIAVGGTTSEEKIITRASHKAKESLASENVSQPNPRTQEKCRIKSAEQPVRKVIESPQFDVPILREIENIIAIESIEKSIPNETHQIESRDGVEQNPTRIDTVALETVRQIAEDPSCSTFASESTTINKPILKKVVESDTRNSSQESNEATGIIREPETSFGTNILHTTKVSDTNSNSKSIPSPAATINTSFDDIVHKLAPIDTNKIPALKMQANDNNKNILNMLTAHIPSDTDSNMHGNENKKPSNQAVGRNFSQSSNQLNGQGYQIVSLFNFGDRPGAPGEPSRPNLPDFLVPSQLITYETSIEINLRKIPPPQPPPPPRFIKKMLVHTESLERRTRAFLTGNFESSTTDNSLRTARQKIRSLKSTILKSDDEVKHAEDTIHKAQSGDFLKIFAPPIVEQPLYEFIEIPPSHPGDEGCVDVLDRHRDRSQSVQKQQDSENMEDYYSSKYSSRTSRRVEGQF